LLKGKDEVFKVCQEFCKMIETQFGKNLKILRSDNGTEFVNQNMHHFLKSKGILHQTTCVGTPQQNGVAERKNRNILEITRSLLLESKMPAIFWDNAVTYAVYLMNRIRTKANEYKTPLQKLSTQVNIPSVLNLEPKVFGCSVYVHLQKQSRTKLESHAIKCIFLGFDIQRKGYKCYCLTNRKFMTSMDVVFIENEFYFTHPNMAQGETSSEPKSGDTEYIQFLSHGSVNPEPNPAEPNPAYQVEQSMQNNPSENQMEGRSRSSTAAESATDNKSDDETDEETEEVIQSPLLPRSLEDAPDSPEVSVSETQFKLPLRSNRGVPPKRYIPEEGTSRIVKYPITKYVTTKSLPKILNNFVAQLSSESVPERLEEACKEKKWIEAMNSEMNALEKNKTWDLVDLPKGKKSVGCKWVYSIKYNEKGIVERYKARLVEKGYTQTYGIDFQETFSPVAKLNTIRVVLSCASNFDWPLHQMDVKNAFLHGNLDEEIYMEVPPGYTCTGMEQKVCKLNKALYGLKQSPRAWFGRFRNVMKSYGFNQAESDHTLFIKRRNGKMVVLIIYVDDMIISGDDEMGIQELKQQLSREFEMKDLGGLKYFLGIEVSRSKKGIFSLTKKVYIRSLE
jgi:Reverse transcriptase (RNA-dependent DNA polymerase)